LGNGQCKDDGYGKYWLENMLHSKALARYHPP